MAVYPGSAVNGTVRNGSWRGKTVKSTAPSSTKVHPLKLASRVHPINMQALGTVNSTQSMLIADCADTLLQVMSFAPRTDTIDFYVLCQANDEKQIKFGPVSKATDVCIEPGFSDNIINLAYYLSNGDSTMILGGKHVVVAGFDKICSNRIQPYQTICPPTFNIPQLIKECNVIYGQIGITFVLGSVDTLKINWDKDGNGMLEDGIIEQMRIHDKYVKIGVAIPKRTKTFLVGSVGTNISGRASVFGKNSLALSQIANGNTLAHEIGHAKYNLRHPDNSPTHLWIETELTIQKSKQFGFQKAPNNNDKANYMHSNRTGRTNNIRAYQIKKIHLNTY